MFKFNDNNEIIHDEINAILVEVHKKGEDISSSLTELEALTEAAGGKVYGVLTQALEKRDSSTCIGKGKTEELKDMAEKLEVNTIIFNNELSGVQIRNLEEITGKRVIDRTILILDIFASRAVSKEGKLQVELAQLEYRMPRLLGFGKSLSRLGGGIGTRGPGEKKLEVDKRHIRKRIDDIRAELKLNEKNRQVQRARREKNEIPIVALVGYTNVGKSALLNRFLEYDDNSNSGSLEKNQGETYSDTHQNKSVKSENMLFATLETTQRNIKLNHKKSFIMVDTVGFVSKLPHKLVEAFKGTLEEVKFADLLILVLDISSDEKEFQEEVTMKTLKELGVTDKKIIKVYNKWDLISEEIDEKICDGIKISATKNINIDVLRNEIERHLYIDEKEYLIKVPFNKGHILSMLYEKGRIIDEKYEEDGTLLRVYLSDEYFNRVKEYVAL